MPVVWFRSANLVSLVAKRTIFKNLRDQIIGSGNIPYLRELLEIGGSDFLFEADFANAADAAVRRIVIPFLENAAGCNWLEAQQEHISIWINGSTDDTKMFASQRFDELLASEPAVATALQRLENIIKPSRE